MDHEYVLIVLENGGIMRTSKRYEKASVVLTGDVRSMLKKAKTVLSHKQYHQLCNAVDASADYTTKKGLINACLQAKNNNF